ncbi:MAG TPA: hypothetical protein VK808_00210 [Bacteroidia bacterium]|nr:hypothetical protein [Bacteroidia bacterium]
MITLKEIYGGTAVCLGMVAYIIYIHSTLKDKIKPHAFSWLLWTLTTAVVFIAQWTKGAGSGSWSTGFTCTVCLAIGVISLFKYDKAYSLSDILFISVALLALIPWFFTKDPTASVVLIASIDVLGYGPTLRKCYYYPDEEKAISFGLNSIKHLFAFMALQNYIVATWIYPASQIFMNGLVVLLIMVRRRQLLRSR